jgi:hypothetical protein
MPEQSTPGKDGSEPAIVISRRMMRRVAIIAGVVVVVAGIGVGAFFAGRSNAPGPHKSAGPTSAASAHHSASTFRSATTTAPSYDLPAPHDHDHDPAADSARRR